MINFSSADFIREYLACEELPEEFRTDVLSARCATIAEKLLENNEKFNLTAITEQKEVLHKHILDSLLGAKTLSGLLSGRPSPRMMDVGSGAGFPSLPIAAALPDLSVTALDATQKKCDHMNETAAAIGLSNFRAVSGRAEDFGQAEAFRHSFDAVTARAVANLPILAELCLPLVKTGGYFLAMKGSTAPQEWEASAAGIAKLGGEFRDMIPYTVPGDPNPRYFLIIQKKSPTPPKYPRHFSQIKKNPLH
jgi:16S rRNA (guanine527-N7)-methyltransferase